MAKVVRAWAKKYFKLFAEEDYLSNTLTVIENTRKIDINNLNFKLAERGFQISNGYGDLKDKTFRISHMGDYTLDDVYEVLKNIDEVLGLEVI